MIWLRWWVLKRNNTRLSFRVNSQVSPFKSLARSKSLSPLKYLIIHENFLTDVNWNSSSTATNTKKGISCNVLYPTVITVGVRCVTKLHLWKMKTG